MEFFGKKKDGAGKEFKHTDLNYSDQFINTGVPTPEDVEKIPLIDADTKQKRRIREGILGKIKKWKI